MWLAGGAEQEVGQPLRIASVSSCCAHMHCICSFTRFASHPGTQEQYQLLLPGQAQQGSEDAQRRRRPVDTRDGGDGQLGSLQ